MENLPLIDPARRLAIELEGGLSIGRPGGHVAATLKGRVKGRRDDGDFDYGVVDAAIDYEPGGELAAEIGLSNLGAAIADVVPVGAGEIREAVGENPEIAIHLRRETPASKRAWTWTCPHRGSRRKPSLVLGRPRIHLSEPERIDWKPSPEFVGRKLTGRESALRNAPAIPSTSTSWSWRARVDDGGSGTFRPGTFALDVSLSTPGDFHDVGRIGRPASDVIVEIDWIESERGLAFDFGVAKLVGRGGKPMKPSRFHGVLADVADGSGFLNKSEMALTSEAIYGTFRRRSSTRSRTSMD